MESEARLVSAVLLEKDVTPAVKQGISAKMFSVDEYEDAFRFIVDHEAKYGQVPSATTVKREISGIRLVQVSDALDVVIDQFLAEFRRARVKALVSSAVDAMSVRKWDTDDVIADIERQLEGLRTGLDSSSVVNLVDTADQRLADYQTRASRPSKLLGISTGFPTIDAATLGLQRQQLVTIVAAPKTGKSQLALRIAKTVHEQGYTPAFLSFEMSNDEQALRHDAMAFGISHLRLMNADLVASELKKYEKGLEALKSSHPFYLVDSQKGMTVDAVAATVRDLKPDVMFIDGVYLMMDSVTGESGTPQALTNITRNLKRMAQRFDIPTVISTQTLTWKMKKNKLDPNSIGYSSSFYQDSDTIFGLERGDEELGDDYRLLKVLASRNTGGAEVELVWDWNLGKFEEISAATTSSVVY